MHENRNLYTKTGIEIEKPKLKFKKKITFRKIENYYWETGRQLKTGQLLGKPALK